MFLTAPLGGDQYDTVGTSGTIDGGSVGILQHLDLLDIIRIEIGKGIDGLTAVGNRLQWLTVDGYAIDDV